MSDAIINVSETDFEEQVLKSSTPTLVDFWAPWCGPCLSIAPVLSELAQEYESKLKVAKMNVDENANVPAEYGVRGIPHMVIIKDGKEIANLTGAVPKPKLKEFIDSHINS